MAGTLDAPSQVAATRRMGPVDLEQQESLAARTLDEWDRGAVPDARRVLDQFGDGFEWDKSIAIRLALGEYQYRRDAGESPDPESFCRGFPTYANSILPCLAAFEALSPLLAGVNWPQPGDEFAGLRIVQELGRGGFARVYLAREPDCGNRFVALKLAPEGASEAHLLGKLAHPNIVAVHGAKHDPDWLLSGLLMPYHGRATLCDVLDLTWSGADPPRAGSAILDAISKRGASAGHDLPAEEPSRWLAKGTYVEGVLSLALQITKGMALAHSYGILHLDLKPSNVLLTPGGVPMLLDFNLSIDQSDPNCRIGGTLPYMSPEQIRTAVLGEDEPVGPRSDIFSLGVLLYQLLYGRLPLDLLADHDASPQRQGAHLLAGYRAGPVLTPYWRDITRSTERIVHRCLAVDPAERFASAEELASALRRELSVVGCVKRRISARQGLAATIATVTVASLTALLIWLVLRPPYSVRMAEAGQAHYRQGEYDLAIGCFDCALKADSAPGGFGISAGGRSNARADMSWRSAILRKRLNANRIPSISRVRVIATSNWGAR